eukprot:gene5264-5930_t
MEEDRESVGHFSILGKKFKKRNVRRHHSAKLRHLLGESTTHDTGNESDSNASEASTAVSEKSAVKLSSLINTSTRRISDDETMTANIDKASSGMILNGRAVNLEESEISDSTVNNEVSDLQSEQKREQKRTVSEECSGIAKITDGMRTMINKPIDEDKSNDFQYKELDSADKFIDGMRKGDDKEASSEIITDATDNSDGVATAEEDSPVNSQPAGNRTSIGNNNENVGNSNKLRRKNNLYDEQSMDRVHSSPSLVNKQAIPITKEDNCMMNNNGAEESLNNDDVFSDKLPSKDGLLSQFSERQSISNSEKQRKRHISSNASDFEKRMTSPLSSSRSSSVRSYSSSLPASIDSGLRMGFQEPHASVVVVAIDFGTTFSGYAFAFSRDPDSIHMMRKWEGGDPGVNNQKIPTTLLLRPEGQFHSFGFGARDSYHDLDPSEAKKWLYFEKFKMTLHFSEDLNPGVLIKAANGKPYPAVKVFAHALRFFKEHVLAELSDQSTARILEEDITWVLTVPAIWRQPAKQFMRTAAHEAGIASWDCSERLLIALEPEAASIFCRKLRIRDCIIEDDVRLRSQDCSLISEDFIGATQYIVVDCGGGTVDLTVHELDVSSGNLKELHRGTGGACGATGVDAEFENLLKRIFDAEFIERFKAKRPAGWVDLIIAFESKKRTARPGGSSALNISLPYSFIDYYKKKKRSSVETAIKKFKNHDIKWSSQGMLRIAPCVMEDLFNPVLRKITSHIQDLLDKPSLVNIQHLFLVGGFAESPLLQTAVRDEFGGRVRVIIPHDVGLTILKGAVLFGLDPTVVKVRRSAFTYGVGVLNKFNADKHDVSKRVVKDGVVWCKDIFDTFVKIDESVGLGDAVMRSYAPARASQKSTVINIYCSEKEQNLYTTDKKVKRCGQLRIEMPELKIEDIPLEKRSKPRELQATMLFGDTELKVTAIDVLTGKTARAVVDFLNY